MIEAFAGEIAASASGIALLAGLGSLGVRRYGGLLRARLGPGSTPASSSSRARSAVDGNALFEALSDPAIVRETDGKLLDANDSADALLGGEAETLGGACPGLGDALERGASTITLSVADGTERTFDIARSPLGEGIELVVLRDITVRRRNEQELLHENERLGELVSTVAHDLRNPLNLAQLQLDLAREDHDSDHLAETAWALDRMDHLIDDLLTMARDGQDVTEVEPVEVDTLAETAWRTVGASEGTLVTAAGRVRADRGRMQQLFENLFRNAIEHGGPDVTVTVGALPTGLYVEDDGPGIPEEMHDSVFDAGYSTKADGTGFGLHIVDRIAAAHGWTVHLTASEDGGARFEIRGMDDPVETPTASTA